MSDQAWHDWRRGGIGGSDIAGALGLSTYASPYSVWCSKVGLLPDKDETPRQRIGKAMEPVLASLFTDETGLYVVGEQTWCEHPEERWMRATADGFAAESPTSSIDDVLGPVEFKTDGRFGWPDGVPVNYRCQALWQLAVTGLPMAWIAVMFAGFRFEVFPIERDDADIALLIEHGRALWEHVLDGTPPPPDGSEATDRALAAVYPGDRDRPAKDVNGGIYAAWTTAKAEAKRWRDMEASLGQSLKAELGDATEGRLDGQTVVSWRPQVSRRIDVDRLRAEHPDVAEQCTTETTTRVLRPHSPKPDKESLCPFHLWSPRETGRPSS